MWVSWPTPKEGTPRAANDLFHLPATCRSMTRRASPDGSPYEAGGPAVTHPPLFGKEAGMHNAPKLNHPVMTRPFGPHPTGG